MWLICYDCIPYSCSMIKLKNPKEVFTYHRLWEYLEKAIINSKFDEVYFTNIVPDVALRCAGLYGRSPKVNLNDEKMEDFKNTNKDPYFRFFKM